MLKEIKENFLKILKNKKYTITLLLVLFLSFGFSLTKSGVISIDTLSYDRYFLGNELLAQGRVTGAILEKIFHVYSFNAYFMDALACILLFLSSTLMCSFFKTISKNKLSDTSLIIFSSIFVSYPLYLELFHYTPAGTNIALGYGLTTISIILSYNYIQKKKKFKFILASLPLFLAISLYESFASVYLLLIFIILILEENNKKEKFKDVFVKGFMLLITLSIAIIINSFISELVIAIMKLEKSTNALKCIYYFSSPLKEAIRNLFLSIYENYFVYAFVYQPITIFVISIFMCIILSIISSKKKKDNNYLILYLGLFLATISLSLIQGSSALYRTCQTFALFIGFIFMMIINSIKEYKVNKTIYKTCIVIMFFVIFRQCYYMNYISYTNYLRYEEEKQVMINVANEIQSNHDTNKEIIVIGNYDLSNNIKNRMQINNNSFKYKLYTLFSPYDNTNIMIGQTNVMSYIDWGITAFGENGTELNKWWNLLGYDFKMASSIDNTYIFNIFINESYPQKGYIVENNKYIIVKF